MHMYARQQSHTHCTHTHACTPTYTIATPFIHVCIYTHVYAQSHIQVYMHTHMYIRVHTHMHVHMYRCVRTYRHIQLNVHSRRGIQLGRHTVPHGTPIMHTDHSAIHTI